MSVHIIYINVTLYFKFIPNCTNVDGFILNALLKQLEKFFDFSKSDLRTTQID